MNHIAMYSGVYEEVREYAELLDEVLIELKGGTSSPQDEGRKKLGQFLKRLVKPRKGDLTTRLFNILLRDNDELDPLELSRIGGLLMSTEADDAVIEPLEKLAKSLEQEQAVAMARMRR